MKCQNCGEEISEQSSTCEKCGHIINTQETNPQARPKTSKLAVSSLISAILAFFTLGISLIFMAIFSRYALRAIKKSEGKLKGRYCVYTARVISGFFGLSVLLFLYFWRMDAEPIPDDYTIDDLVSAPEEYNITYDLLMSLEDYNDFIPKSHFIYEYEPSEETTDKLFNILKQIYADSGSNSTPIDINDFPDYRHIVSELESILSGMDYEKRHLLAQLIAEDVNQQWLRAAPAREIINKLSQYDHLADLAAAYLQAEFPSLREIRDINLLYNHYVIVQAEQGNIDESINELIRINSVFRKLSVNARSIITKLVCIAIFAKNLNTANYIINHSDINGDQVQRLSQHFQPLTDSETSLKNAFTNEYLMFRNTLDDMLKSAHFFSTERFFIKRNSTLRVKRNFYNRVLYNAGEADFYNPITMYPGPVDIFFDDSIVEDIFNYEISLKDKIYNPVGIMLISILMPAYDMLFEIRTRLQIDDDLFQIIIKKTAG